MFARTKLLRLNDFLRHPRSAHKHSHQKIDGNRRRNGKEQRANKRRPKRGPNDPRKHMPIQVIAEPELPETHTMRHRAMQAPAPQMIFGNIERGHRPNHHIVQGHRNGRSDLIAPTNPCYGDRQQRLKRVQRRETEKNSDCRTKRDGVRRVCDGHQRHVVRDQPALKSRQWPRQSRFVNWVRH
jgi:hypothetical protein